MSLRMYGLTVAAIAIVVVIATHAHSFTVTALEVKILLIALAVLVVLGFAAYNGIILMKRIARHGVHYMYFPEAEHRTSNRCTCYYDELGEIHGTPRWVTGRFCELYFEAHGVWPEDCVGPRPATIPAGLPRPYPTHRYIG